MVDCSQTDIQASVRYDDNAAEGATGLPFNITLIATLIFDTQARYCVD